MPTDPAAAETPSERCSWRDCAEPASVPQTANDGEVWARLCSRHDAEMDAAIKAGDPKAILRCWARAHGTKENFARRMMGGSRG